MSTEKLATTSMSLSMLLSTVMILSMKKQKFNSTNKSPFECGFKKESSKNSFSSQFITITLLFLMFDLEIVMIMPSPLTEGGNSKNLMAATAFMAALAATLLIEWSKGMVEWKGNS